MALMGIREYARHRGVRHRAVQKAIESGRIRAVDGEDGRPKIDPVQADRDWELNTDETRVAFTANGGRLLDDGASVPADDDLEDEDDVDDAPLSGADDHAKAYRHARAIREAVEPHVGCQHRRKGVSRRFQGVRGSGQRPGRQKTTRILPISSTTS